MLVEQNSEEQEKFLGKFKFYNVDTLSEGSFYGLQRGGPRVQSDVNFLSKNLWIYSVENGFYPRDFVTRSSNFLSKQEKGWPKMDRLSGLEGSGSGN